MENVLQSVKAVLGTTSSRWQTLIEMLPSQLIERPTRPGQESAKDWLRHLLAAEIYLFPVRVRDFMSGREDFLPIRPDQEYQPNPEPSAIEMAHEFARIRQASLSMLEGVTPGDLERSAVHTELGQVKLGQLISEWALHDLAHSADAELALMQPFIQNAGGWRQYFKKYDVELAPET